MPAKEESHSERRKEWRQIVVDDKKSVDDDDSGRDAGQGGDAATARLNAALTRTFGAPA